jgi:hypothetical protein
LLRGGSQPHHHQDIEYLIALIADCHRQKYQWLIAKNEVTAAVAEISQALKTAREHLPEFGGSITIHALQKILNKHLPPRSNSNTLEGYDNLVEERHKKVNASGRLFSDRLQSGSKIE